MRRKYICPVCKEKTGVNIMYGMPGPELFDLIERGEVALGGCVIIDGQPDRRCTACGAEWLIKRKLSDSKSS